MGRTDVEDALLRLDSLTKEECLMVVTRNLEITHNVERNVKEIKAFAEGTDDRVQVMERVTHSVDQTVKVVEKRTQCLRFTSRTHELIPIPIVSLNRN